jgi:glycerol-3-phosphate responsive antiterminator
MDAYELTNQVWRLIDLYFQRNRHLNRYIKVSDETTIDIIEELTQNRQAIEKIYENPSILRGFEDRLQQIEDNIQKITEGNIDLNIPQDLVQQVNKNTQDIIYILQLIQFGITGSGHGNQLDSMRLDNAVLV